MILIPSKHKTSFNLQFNKRYLDVDSIRTSSDSPKQSPLKLDDMWAGRAELYIAVSDALLDIDSWMKTYKLTVDNNKHRKLKTRHEIKMKTLRILSSLFICYLCSNKAMTSHLLSFDESAPKSFSLYVANYSDETVSEIVDGRVTNTIKVGRYPCALTSCHDKVYVANYGSHTVSEIVDGQVTKTIAVGKYPNALTSCHNKIYVANGESHTIREIVDGRVTKTIAVGKNPWALTSWHDKIYVANQESNTVSEIVDGQVTKTIAVGKNPRALTSWHDKIYVANQGSNTVSEI
ncbi:MAG: YncE family protein, partial [Nitrosopumilus sp.]|nr:YncE family protein [Nitrosopumilus sp.]